MKTFKNKDLIKSINNLYLWKTVGSESIHLDVRAKISTTKRLKESKNINNGPLHKGCSRVLNWTKFALDFTLKLDSREVVLAKQDPRQMEIIKSENRGSNPVIGKPFSQQKF